MATKATWVIGCACLLASAPTLSSESLLAVVRSCAAQADESARLQCFDRGVAQFRGATDDAGGAPCLGTGISQPAASSKSPAITAHDTPAAPNGSNTEQFGLTSGQVLRKNSAGAPTSTPKQVTARIVTLSHRPGGTLVASLDNGQTWEQTEDGPDLHIAAGDPVKVERGLLGAYWLSPVPGHLAVKVKRTQ
jgi:hypothetical protein